MLPTTCTTLTVAFKGQEGIQGVANPGAESLANVAHVQVFHLQQAGVSCGYLSGSQEYEESRAIMQSLQAHPPGVKVLFVTPEKVARSDYLMRALDSLHSRQLLVRRPHSKDAWTCTTYHASHRIPEALRTGRLAKMRAAAWQDRVAIDEAHCVSQWGEPLSGAVPHVDLGVTCE